MEVNPTSLEADRPEEDTPQRLERQRQPPVRYGLDEYADIMTTENYIQHYVCQIVEPNTMMRRSHRWYDSHQSEYCWLLPCRMT